MKLSAFHDLCRREWDKCHGDILNLWLTEESYRELSDETLLAGAQDQMLLYVNSDYADLGPAHPMFSNVVNPITRTAVKMRLARDQDAADCFSGKTKQMYTVVLPKEENCDDSSPQPV